jgi:thiol:disulfide interchange protein
MRLFRLVQFIVLFAVFCVFYDHAVAEETNSPNLSCASVDTIASLDSVLSSSSEKAKKTLVYFRADWAVAGIYKNDTYVPSIAFMKAIGNAKCVIADVTRINDSEFLKRFDADGIPFFVLFDSGGERVSTLKHARDFFEFKEWLSSVTTERQPK